MELYKLMHIFSTYVTDFKRQFYHWQINFTGPNKPEV